MTTVEMLELLREWVKAQILAGIADAEPDSEGYIGGGYVDNKIADDLFEKLTQEVTK